MHTFHMNGLHVKGKNVQFDCEKGFTVANLITWEADCRYTKRALCTSLLYTEGSSQNASLNCLFIVPEWLPGTHTASVLCPSLKKSTVRGFSQPCLKKFLQRALIASVTCFLLCLSHEWMIHSSITNTSLEG